MPKSTVKERRPDETQNPYSQTWRDLPAQRKEGKRLTELLTATELVASCCYMICSLRLPNAKKQRPPFQILTSCVQCINNTAPSSSQEI